MRSMRRWRLVAAELSTAGPGASSPPIGAPCPPRLRHGDPMRAQERLTAAAAAAFGKHADSRGAGTAGCCRGASFLLLRHERPAVRSPHIMGVSVASILMRP
jgi:hypothetical protein